MKFFSKKIHSQNTKKLNHGISEKYLFLIINICPLGYNINNLKRSPDYNAHTQIDAYFRRKMIDLKEKVSSIYSTPY